MSQQLLQELKTNARLRLGLWVILTILAGYGVLLIDEHRIAAKNEYHQALNRLTQLESITDQSIWFERAEQAALQKQAILAKVWPADTQGLAQANFQAWLEEQFKQLNIARTQLRIESATSVLPQQQIWAVSALVQGEFETKAMMSFLHQIESHAYQIIVERFEVQALSRRVIFTLLLTTYFKLP